MQLPLYQVDAFANRLFTGNPAAVCPLSEWPSEATMQAIATENNLSETAFVVPGNGRLGIRWFTPNREVHLCGHATLAAAWVWLEHCAGEPKPSALHFDSVSGPLTVTREADGRLTLDFPVAPAEPAEPPAPLTEGLDAAIVEVAAGDDWLVRLENEAAVRTVAPDIGRLRALDRRGVIVTAEGDEADFVSRFFAPNFGIAEDPVTGSAHCMLTPFWAERLGKERFRAQQLSARGGELACALAGDRVRIGGHVVPYLAGTLELSGN
ncbi:PhzF family phenazine biosynthesis protein [Thiohalorhabdus methylotrophus]|uniref:PhzF family phenazine biosynthesis protein n=1 Tax=Thiohalorhabdus methylotrophus TaxID=3242694 RepID=A0ABV4TYU1_9GAMM